jgi:hypothetical protein
MAFPAGINPTNLANGTVNLDAIAPEFTQLTGMLDTKHTGTAYEVHSLKSNPAAALEQRAKRIATLKAKGMDTKALEAQLESAGVASHLHLDKVEGHVTKALGQIEEVRTELDKALAGGLSQDKYDKAMSHLAKEEEKLMKVTGRATELVEEARGHVVTHSGVAAKAGASAVVKDAVTGAKSVATKLSQEVKDMGIVGETAFKEQNWVKRQLGAAKANWNVGAIEEGTGKITKAGNMGRFARVAGTGVGAVLGGYGIKDLGQVVGVISPDIDEQGKEIPADSGKLFKAAAELGAGAALVYMSLLKGGHNKAMTNIAHL